MTAHDSTPATAPAFARFPSIAGWLVSLVGLIVFAGWVLDVTWTRQLVPGSPTMKANTALAFICAGGAVGMICARHPGRWRRLIATGCAMLVTLIGLATLIEYGTGRDLGIDQRLFPDPATAAELHPGRMAIPSALSFSLIGVAIIALWLDRPRVAQTLALAAALPAYVVLAGYVFGSRPQHTSMAAHTAITFLLLAAAIVSARPEVGPMTVIRDKSPTGLLARRLLLAALVLPLLLGWLRLAGQRAGIFGAESGLALFAASNVVLLVGLILWNARSLLALDLRRHAAEAKERRTAEQLRIAAVSGNVGLWDWDLGTNEVYFSSQWKAQLGHAENEIPNRFEEWESRLHPADRERTLSKLHLYLAKPWPDFEYDFRLRHKDGSYRWILARADVLQDAQGKILRMTGCHIDVTERKHAEEELRRTLADLKRSNAELAQFAYIASHDLQEPLRAVGGCVQLLARRYQGKLDERADELIRHTVDGVTRMQSLIQDLLAYSRAGSQKAPLVPTDSGKALEAALANLSVTIHERGAVITHDTLPTLPADRSQLVQLFQNLVANGIKFCTARQPEIHVGAQSRDGEHVFSVRDNGIGIDAQYHERIFEIFQRLHTRTEYPGTGIGLALCKRIVERHGGRIWVQSEPGRGTTIYFSLPAIHEAAQ